MASFVLLLCMRECSREVPIAMRRVRWLKNASARVTRFYWDSFSFGTYYVCHTQTLFSLSQRSSVDALDCCQRALDVEYVWFLVCPLLINYRSNSSALAFQGATKQIVSSRRSIHYNPKESQAENASTNPPWLSLTFVQLLPRSRHPLT